MIKCFWYMLLGGLLAFSPYRALAVEFCDMQSVVATYKAALHRKKYGDVESAHKTFLKLAHAAVAPAQRHVAEYFLEEARGDMALEKAIMWSQLATWGGDAAAQDIVKRAVDSARHQVANTGLAWAKDWRPSKADCGLGAGEQQKGDDFQVVGRFPIIRHEKLDEDIFAAFATRLGEAFSEVEAVAPYFAPLVQLIPALEILPSGEGSDRFIQWGEENEWVQVSASFLHDQSPRQLAYSLVLAAQRHLFAKLDDAEFQDQIATRYGKIKIYGSLYGDVKTKEFLSQMSEAIKQARELPVILRDKVNFLDEIHYMPPSRYHDRRFPDSKLFATYDYRRSHPEKRMMVVTHEIAFQTVEELILELVRVGELAQEHVRIEGMKGQVNSKKREDAILQALQGNLKKMEEAFTGQTAKKQESVTAWEANGPDAVTKVYCESVYAQVKAAIALKMDAISASQTIKFRNCAKARKVWRDYRSGETKK